MALTTGGSLMAAEAAESGHVVARQYAESAAAFAALGARLRAAPPRFVVTCARGSSDHACVYGKYLIETTLGLPVASVGPSIASVYGRQLALRDSLFIAVSQSGRSPDLLSLAASARESGALVVGFVNDMDSELPALCDACIPLAAGPELSVAATKSCLAAMAAFLHLVAHWSEHAGLLSQVAGLPAALDAARDCDWLPALAGLVQATGLFVVGRGVGFAAALEMALKCKETSRLHAEAFSAAEVVHGPLALVGPGFPVIALSQADATAGYTRTAVERMVALGGPVLLAGDVVPGATALPTPALPPESAPLAALLSFYLAIDQIARARGLDPDRPANLNKVTRTT
jgi:glucosamine--fructose-6-phosphate aminotransferase (isomerizing)